MGKTKKSAKSSNSVRFLRRSRALQSFKRDFRFANDPKVELARVKHNADLRDLFDLMPLIFKDAPTYDLIHGSAFPRGLNLLFSVPPIHRPADLVREIIWGIGRCLKFSEALRGFVLQRRLFEIEILQDNQQSAAHTLAKIKESFGYSFWLAQNELAIARHWGGLAEMKQCYDGLGLNENSANIISTLLWFVRHRIEATMELSQLKGELVNAMSKIDSESARAFFRAKLFDFMEISPLDMAPLLYRDAQSSLIDHYESLVAVLQSLSSLKDVPTALLDNLSIPIQSLLKATKDIRLNAVSRAFGKIDFPEDPSFDNREVAIEAFLGGRFDESVLASNAVLAKAPDDMAIFVLKHKALIATDAAIPEYSGVLSRLSKDITCLLQFSKETYEAAHDILLLSSQFFGLNWIAYLRAVAHYELRAESDEYPPIWLRDMHVRDLGVSPFSAVACANSVVDQFLKDEQFERKFKLSKIAYAAITEGLNLTEAGIDSTRYDMLRARYELTFGSSLAAQSIYSRLIPIVRGPNRIRCSAGSALALKKLGLLQEALDVMVTAYVTDPHVPSALPIQELVNAIENPRHWPRSICVPIALELYQEYCGSDKITDLRYSFEVFQTQHNILVPQDLISLRFPPALVVLYLARVWHPEIMRHSLIYASSREVEEMRIKVCQTLAEIDPDNTEKYHDEIKDRVKRLAIAQGVNLAEKSKVFVDILAIKKEVVKRLENTYKKYKSAQSVTPSRMDSFAETLLSALSQSLPNEDLALALSELHIYRDVVSEDEAQFDAMYADILREFLKGAHGLNVYLSTRIRHGVLSSVLRKSSEDAKIVTLLEADRSTYVKNEFWISKLTPGENDLIEELTAFFNDFSSSFDAVLDDLRDNLLQIQIVEDRTSAGSSSALFKYNSSNLERLTLKSQDRKSRELEELIDRCIDHLWLKTDENLRLVQAKLDGSVRNSLIAPFETLAEQVRTLRHLSIASDLLNAVSRAKTDTQTQLMNVISWFRRSEVYDRVDYAPDFLLEVAHKMIRNTVSQAANWTSVQVDCSRLSEKLPGRTFDGMVYLFYGLLENAIKRSKLDIDNLLVKVSLSFNDGILSTGISNNIDSSLISVEERERVDNIKKAIELQESASLAQREGVSGLYKVWLTLNGPLYTNPKLDFGFENDSFFVKTSCRVGR